MILEKLSDIVRSFSSFLMYYYYCLVLLFVLWYMIFVLSLGNCYFLVICIIYLFSQSYHFGQIINRIYMFVYLLHAFGFSMLVICTYLLHSSKLQVDGSVWLSYPSLVHTNLCLSCQPMILSTPTYLLAT